MIQSIRDFYFKKLEKNFNHQSAYSGFESIKKVLILSEEDYLAEHFKEANSFFSSYDLEMISYVPRKQKKEEERNKHLFKSDINWKYFPKEAVVRDYTNTEYDLFIDLGSGFKRCLNVLSRMINAKFRITASNSSSLPSDLSIISEDAKSFVKELENCLKRINNG